MTKQFIYIFIIIIMLACDKSKQSKTIEEDSLTPFELTIDANTAITTEDHQKLANAKGRKVQNIEVLTLQKQIQTADEKIHLFHFWKLENENSLNINADLEKIALRSTEDIEVVLVNLDTTTAQKTVNTYLRTQGITSTAYQLKTTQAWTHKIDKNWDGQLPYLLIVHQNTSTFLSYQQVLSYETMYAILQPLL